MTRRTVRIAVIGAVATASFYWFALAAHAQMILSPVQAHVSGDQLVTSDQSYTITWGHNCDAIPFDGDVLMWPVDGVPDQVALAPLDEDGAVVTLVATGDDTVTSLLCSALLSPASNNA
jgi:hypothetical protein